MWVSENKRLGARLETRIDSETLAAARAAAARLRRPLSFVVREALQAWLSAHAGAQGSPAAATLKDETTP